MGKMMRPHHKKGSQRPSKTLMILVVLALAMSILPVAATTAQAATISGGWTAPLDSMPGVSAGFLASSCNGSDDYVPGNYHLGVDYPKPAGTPVRAIGAGTVVLNGDFGGSWGRAVFVRHHAGNGREFIALYGHLNTVIGNGTSVSAGQQLGTVLTDHLHFGLRPDAGALPSSGWGMLPCSRWADTNGFTDPMPFLAGNPVTEPNQPPPGDVENGGFEDGGTRWTADGAHFTTYPAQSVTEPFEGSRFGAISNPSGGGSVRQDVTGTVAAGRTYCATARLTTNGSGSGARGVLAIWMLGGSKQEKSDVSYNVPGGNEWALVRTCATSTVEHSAIRVEFYPATGTPDTGIDKVSLYRSYIRDGGFNNGTAWTPRNGANFSLYSDSPYEGTRYAATNNGGNSGSSVYLDITYATQPGYRFCANIMVRDKDGSGAGGTAALWFRGEGGATEQISMPFTTPADGSWKHFGGCLTLTRSHSHMRAEVYSNSNKTLDFDAFTARRYA